MDDFILENGVLNKYKGGAVVIPEGVSEIGNWAFYGCSGLTSVTIPAGVTSIGNRAFGNCSLTIQAPAGSFAEQFAEKRGLPFEAISDAGKPRLPLRFLLQLWDKAIPKTNCAALLTISFKFLGERRFGKLRQLILPKKVRGIRRGYEFPELFCAVFFCATRNALKNGPQAVRKRLLKTKNS